MGWPLRADIMPDTGAWPFATRWLVAPYDRVYRFLHNLDSSASEVGPAVRVEVRRSHRTLHLADGTTIRLGDPVGVLHLNNDFVVALHADGLLPVEVGPAFRRQLLGSLHELAGLAGPGGRLTDVKAFFATTTFFQEGFKQLGFEAEDKAPSWLRLRPSIPQRTRRLWVSRKTLLVRYGAAARLGA